MSRGSTGVGLPDHSRGCCASTPADLGLNGWSNQWVRHHRQRLSTYGTILTASHCGASRRGPGTRPRAVVCWRWPRFYDGGSRTDASRIGGVGLQIIRDWVLRFNARGPDGLVDGKSPGAPSKLNADHRRALAEVVEAGPVPAVDGVVRWRRKDLARWLLETFAISLDETTVGRELKALGFAKISARPRHYAQNELAVEAFPKKIFPALGGGKVVRIP